MYRYCRLTTIPSDLSQCHKLHAFNYAGNKLADKKLAKMMDQCSTKAVLGKDKLEYCELLLRKIQYGQIKKKEKRLAHLARIL